MIQVQFATARGFALTECLVTVKSDAPRLDDAILELLLGQATAERDKRHCGPLVVKLHLSTMGKPEPGANLPSG
jgi:hypothetical protein